jgi:hypothetical protein
MAGQRMRVTLLILGRENGGGFGRTVTFRSFLDANHQRLFPAHFKAGIRQRDTKHSTAARLLKAGDLAGACQQLPRWAKAQIGGVMLQLPGLVKRREKERQLCLSGLDSVSEADGRGEGLFTPPAFYSEQESVLADSEFTSPRRNTLCAAFKTHHDIAFRVPLLLVNSRPSAVAWEVPLRSINAVQSASIRSLAHVSQEVFEFKPRLTNCNPNGAVARISWVVRPSASTPCRK